MITRFSHSLLAITGLTVALLIALTVALLDGSSQHRQARADPLEPNCDTETVGTVDSEQRFVPGEFIDPCWSEGGIGVVPDDSYVREIAFDTDGGTLTVVVIEPMPTDRVYLQLLDQPEEVVGFGELVAEVGSGTYYLRVSLPREEDAASFAFNVALRVTPDGLDEPPPTTPEHIPTSEPTPVEPPTPITESPPTTPERVPALDPTPDEPPTRLPVPSCLVVEEIETIAGREFEVTGDLTVDHPFYCYILELPVDFELELTVGSDDVLAWVESVGPDQTVRSVTTLAPRGSTSLQAHGVYHVGVALPSDRNEMRTYVVEFLPRPVDEGPGEETTIPTLPPTEKPTATPTPTPFVPPTPVPTPTARPEPRESVTYNYRNRRELRETCEHPLGELRDLSERARNGLRRITVYATLDDDECRRGKTFPFAVSGLGLSMRVEVLTRGDVEIISLSHPSGTVRFCSSNRSEIWGRLTRQGQYELRVREDDDPDANFELGFRLSPVTDPSADWDLDRCQDGGGGSTGGQGGRDRPGIQTFIRDYCIGVGLADECKFDAINEWVRLYGSGGSEPTEVVETPTPVVAREPTPPPDPIQIETLVVFLPGVDETEDLDPGFWLSSIWTDAYDFLPKDPKAFGQFIAGALCGQICTEYGYLDPDSSAFVAGYVVVGTIPFLDIVPDLRDAVLESYHCWLTPEGIREHACDYGDLAVNWASVLPFVGKAGDVVQAANILKKAAKSNPELAKYLGKQWRELLHPVDEVGPEAFRTVGGRLQESLTSNGSVDLGLAAKALDSWSKTRAVSTFKSVDGMFPPDGVPYYDNAAKLTVVGRVLNDLNRGRYKEFLRVTKVLDDLAATGRVGRVDLRGEVIALNQTRKLTNNDLKAAAKRLGFDDVESEFDVVGQGYYLEIHGVLPGGLSAADKKKFKKQLLLAAQNKKKLVFALFADDAKTQERATEGLKKLVAAVESASGRRLDYDLGFVGG